MNPKELREKVHSLCNAIRDNPTSTDLREELRNLTDDAPKILGPEDLETAHAIAKDTADVGE